MKNPGDHMITFGRWGKENPQGIKIKHLKYSDIEWIAKHCTHYKDAGDAAKQYMEENPSLFEKKKKPVKNNGSMLGGRRASWDKRR